MLSLLNFFVFIFFCLSCRLFSHEFSFTPSGGTIGKYKLYPCLTFGTEFSLSPKNSIANDYINSNVTSLYNYNFEAGFSYSRLFTGAKDNYQTHIRQVGILLGSSHFVSGFDEEQSHSLFFQDKLQRGYRTHRYFVHNTHYVTLRAMTSIQLDFMPKNLLLVSGVKFGYKYSERYEDNLNVEDEGVSQYLPQHRVQGSDNGLYQYSILKQGNPNDLLLYGFSAGLAYQIPIHLDNVEGYEDLRLPHYDIWIGMNYLRGNIYGSKIQNYIFYGISFRLTLLLFKRTLV